MALSAILVFGPLIPMRDENDWNSRFRRAARRLRSSGPSSPAIRKSESSTLSPPRIVNSGTLRTIESPTSNQAAHFSQLILTRPLKAGILRCRHSGTFCEGIKLLHSRATGDLTKIVWCLFWSIPKSRERLVGVDTHLHAQVKGGYVWDRCRSGKVGNGSAILLKPCQVGQQRRNCISPWL